MQKSHSIDVVFAGLVAHNLRERGITSIGNVHLENISYLIRTNVGQGKNEIIRLSTQNYPAFKSILGLVVDYFLNFMCLFGICSCLELVVFMFFQEEKTNSTSLSASWENFIEAKQYFKRGNFEDESEYDQKFELLKNAIEEFKEHPQIRNYYLYKQLCLRGLLTLGVGIITGILFGFGVLASGAVAVGVICAVWGGWNWRILSKSKLTTDNDCFAPYSKNTLMT